VDDNEVNQKLSTRLMEKGGYSCDVAANGVEALSLFERGRYDLVFMDCFMPEMDGFAAAAKIREIEKERGMRVPIIALTAEAMKGSRERCIAAGMDDYLSKPITARALYEMIAKHLAAREKAAGRAAASRP